MFGLGIQELIVLGLVGILVVFPIVIVVFLLKRNKEQVHSKIEELEAENRELREQIGERRGKSQ